MVDTVMEISHFFYFPCNFKELSFVNNFFHYTICDRPKWRFTAHKVLHNRTYPKPTSALYLSSTHVKVIVPWYNITVALWNLRNER